MASETIKSGGVTAVLNQDAVIKGLDAISDGAASSFLSEARRVMSKIKEEAEEAGPDRTRERERGFNLEERVGTDTLAVVLSNPVSHAYVARYSVRTAEEMERSIASLNPPFAEGSLGENVQIWANRRMGRRVNLPEMKEMWRQQLYKWHGVGAPTEQLAGKHAWSWHVRRRVRQETDGLIDAVRADLDRLAEKF